MVAAHLSSDAERMDRHYRFQRYIYDATRTHYLLGRKHLLHELRPMPGQTVLEIGCGTAWNLARAAKAYPQARLFGVDVSAAMLETARASLLRQGLGRRVDLSQGDATNFVPAALFGASTFDRIFFSYALSMIPRWQDALAHAAVMIAPGGSLHIADFGQCGELPATFKRLLLAFLDHYEVTPRADLANVARQVAVAHGLVVDARRLHRGYTDYVVLTRPA